MLCDLTVPASLDRLRPALDEAVTACSEGRARDEQFRWTLRTVLREALANAIVHGAGADPARSVRVVAASRPEGVRVTVEDPGEGYEPEEAVHPGSAGGRERSRGRGLLLVRALADEVEIGPRGRSISFVVRGR